MRRGEICFNDALHANGYCLNGRDGGHVFSVSVSYAKNMKISFPILIRMSKHEG